MEARIDRCNIPVGGRRAWPGCSVRAQVPRASAEIRGAVRINGGRPVASAFVTAVPVEQALGPGARAPGVVTTNQRGEFAIRGLKGGRFRLCVWSAEEEVLDPCEWSQTPPLAEVPDNAVAAGVDLEVPKGKTLRIHVDDPDGVAPTPVRPRPNAFLQFGVRTLAGVHHKARLVSSDRRGHNYELIVPADMEFTLVVDSYNLEVSDEGGAAARGAFRRVRSDATTIRNGMRFSVAAARQP